MRENELSVCNLTVSIGDRTILHEISFSVSQNENITVLGPNGAGKTTLLKAIASTIGFKGDITLNGKKISLMSPYTRASKLGVVAQHPDIDADFTVKTFMELSRYPYKKPWERLTSADRSIIEESLQLTGCTDFMDRQICSLSGGERQKVFIAAAIAQDTPIILFDEPLSHLDPVQRNKMSKLISVISSERKKTVITVTHEINEAIQNSSRIIVIDKGKIAFDGSCGDTSLKKVLDKVFETEFISADWISGRQPLLFPGEN